MISFIDNRLYFRVRPHVGIPPRLLKFENDSSKNQVPQNATAVTP